ncbi:hypothetical protein MferCBS31731_005750 [Microsporum ferrugineum]
MVVISAIVHGIEHPVDADNDLLFLAWENPLLAWSIVDYATICPTVFSALVLAAYAMCSGLSTVNLLVRVSRGVFTGIAGSSIWHALAKGDLLGLVFLVLGFTFDTTYSLLRPQWAERIYADLAIHPDVPVVGAVLLPSTFMVACFIVGPSLLAFWSGMYGAFMDNSGVQSRGCHYHGYTSVPLAYQRQRDVGFQRLFCEGEIVGFELVDRWEEFVEAQLYNWEMFQLVAFTAVLAVVCIFFIVEWLYVESHSESTCLGWLNGLSFNFVDAATAVNGDAAANAVGTPVESQPSGTHHGADKTKQEDANPDADKNLAVMNQMASRIRDLERTSSHSISTVTRLRAEVHHLALELMTKQQSLLTSQEECADLKSLLATERELTNNQDASVTSLQEQLRALLSTNEALQAKVSAQSLELQKAAQVPAPVKAPVDTPVEAPVKTVATRPAKYDEVRPDNHHTALLKRQLKRARRHRRTLIAGNAKCHEQLSAQESAIEEAGMALAAQLEAVSQLTARNEAQLRSLAALEMENNERDAEVADFEKQHDAFVADLKRRLSDQTAVVENLWSQAREKDATIAELQEKLSSQGSGSQQPDHASKDRDMDCELMVVESMYDALIAEKDQEIKDLADEKESLRKRLEQRAKEFDLQRAEFLKQANTIEKLRRRLRPREGQQQPSREGQSSREGQPSRDQPEPSRATRSSRPSRPSRASRDAPRSQRSNGEDQRER